MHVWCMLAIVAHLCDFNVRVIDVFFLGILVDCLIWQHKYSKCRGTIRAVEFLSVGKSKGLGSNSISGYLTGI